ncbi:MAG: lipid kinase, partial [Mesorhizobium sp.]
GEIVTSTPAHFKVHPKAISVFAPAAARTQPRTKVLGEAVSATSG